MTDLPIVSLEHEVNNAVAELLSDNIYHKPCYNPALRRVAERLKRALLLVPANDLRPDVRLFAQKMSLVMAFKSNEKGEPDDRLKRDALMRLSYHHSRILSSDVIGDAGELRKHLIHIANFAMMAESYLKGIEQQ